MSHLKAIHQQLRILPSRPLLVSLSQPDNHPHPFTRILTLKTPYALVVLKRITGRYANAKLDRGHMGSEWHATLSQVETSPRHVRVRLDPRCAEIMSSRLQLSLVCLFFFSPYIRAGTTGERDQKTAPRGRRSGQRDALSGCHSKLGE